VGASKSEELEGVVREFLEAMGEGPLSHPSRLAIMLILVMRGRTTFSELQQILGLTPGNLGSHLEKLEREGYVEKFRCLRGLRYLTCYRSTRRGSLALGRVLRSASNLWEILGAAESAGRAPPKEAEGAVNRSWGSSTSCRRL